MSEQFFTTANQWLFYAVIVLQGLDVVSTNLVLRHGGREANGLVARIMEALGRFWHVPKILIAVGGAWVAKTYGTPWLACLGMAILCATYVWVLFFNNFRIYRALRGTNQ